MDKDCIKMTPWTVARLMRDMELSPGDPKKLFFDMSSQRSSGMWVQSWKSELIHSLLQGYVIPAVHVIRLGTENIRPMSVIDGKQRITSIREYVSDLFKLSSSTPDVIVHEPCIDEYGSAIYGANGEIKTKIISYQIANKKFSQLPIALKNMLIDSTINVITYDNVTDQEVAVQMARLNRQKVFNGVQRANVIVGERLASVVEAITKNNFFVNRVVLNETQKRSGGLKRIVYQCLLIYVHGSTIGLTNANIEKFVRNNDLTEDSFDTINRILNDLDSLLPNDGSVNEHMNSLNVPILIINYDKYEQLSEDGEITRADYKDFLAYWFKNGIFCCEYQKNINKESMNKRFVDGRINVMEDYLVKFIAKRKNSLK